jgi:hypothetical protein
LVLKINSITDKIKGNEDNITIRVLTDPEHYIKKINNILICIVAISVFLFGSVVYKNTKRLDFAILAQAFPLSFSSLLENLPRLEPEPVLVASAYFLATIFVPLTTKQKDEVEHIWWFSLMTGIILGIGVVSKVTFIPLLLLIFILPKFRDIIFAIISFVVTVVILTIPIWSAIPRMIEWFTRLVTHTGRYGHGDAGFPLIPDLISNGISLYHTVPILFYFIPALLLISILDVIRKKPYKLNRVIIIIVFVLITQLIATIKHPSPSGHYLMPTMALSGFIILNILMNLPQRYPYFLISIFFILCTISIGKAELATKNNLLKYQKVHNDFLILKRISKEKYCCRTADYYTSSSKEFALIFGNGYSQNNYRRELAKIYPDYISYNLWGKYFLSFKHHYSKKNKNLLFRNDENICLIGTKSLPFNGQPSVKMLDKRGVFKLYKYIGWNEDS